MIDLKSNDGWFNDWSWTSSSSICPFLIGASSWADAGDGGDPAGAASPDGAPPLWGQPGGRGRGAGQAGDRAQATTRPLPGWSLQQIYVYKINLLKVSFFLEYLPYFFREAFLFIFLLSPESLVTRYQQFFTGIFFTSFSEIQYVRNTIFIYVFSIWFQFRRNILIQILKIIPVTSRCLKTGS